jgi:hypothetical protein
VDAGIHAVTGGPLNLLDPDVFGTPVLVQCLLIQLQVLQDQHPEEAQRTQQPPEVEVPARAQEHAGEEDRQRAPRVDPQGMRDEGCAPDQTHDRAQCQRCAGACGAHQHPPNRAYPPSAYFLRVQPHPCSR